MNNRGHPPPIIHPLLELVRDHVDSVYTWYVVLQQGRAEIEPHFRYWRAERA